MTAIEAIDLVRKKHPRIKCGHWRADWTPDKKDPKFDCWWVTNDQGRKNGRREWTVDPHTSEVDEM